MKPLLTNTVLAVILCCTLGQGHASAQTATAAEARSAANVESLVAADTRTEQEMAAILCANEGSWREADCTVIIQIRMRTAQGRNVSLREALVRLHGDRSLTRSGERRMTASLRSDRITNPREGDSRAWLADLRADGHRPAGFPDDGSWEGRYRAEWMKIYELAGQVIRGRVASPCEGPQPTTWGGPRVDHEALMRMYALGYVQARCAGTRNVFLAGGPGHPVAPNAPTPPRAREEPQADIRPLPDVPRTDG